MIFFCVFLAFLLHMMSTRFIHVIVYAVDFSLLCIFLLYRDTTIYSFYFDVYLGYFKFWALIGKASMNILVNMFL